MPMLKRKSLPGSRPLAWRSFGGVGAASAD